METLQITGTNKECFKDSMSLIGNYGHFRKVEGYKVENNNLLFYWHRDCKECACPFPYDMTLEQAADFAWGWLQSVMPVTKPYGGDGDTVKGWVLVSEDLCYTPEGGCCYESYCFIKITPTWIYYGK